MSSCLLYDLCIYRTFSNLGLCLAKKWDKLELIDCVGVCRCGDLVTWSFLSLAHFLFSKWKESGN